MQKLYQFNYSILTIQKLEC